MDIRINHRHMTRGQKDVLIQAILLLKNDVESVLRPGRQKRYDDYVQVHRSAMGGPGAFMPMPHRSPLFFPWHRVFLRQFEQDLQRAVSDSSLTLPFWDWSLEGPSNPFTPGFLGGNGDSAQDQRITSGPFALQGGRFEVRLWDLELGDSGLRRELGTEPGAHLPDSEQVLSALSKTPYGPGPDSWVNYCEGMLHDPVHRWVGGNMSLPTSPNDPVFFLHHCYLDLLWERWKRQHPSSAAYYPVSGVPGLDREATLVFHAPGDSAPWPGTWTVDQVISSEALDYTYGLFTSITTCAPVPPVCDVLT
ncbi:tyrosinase [Pseudomonas sp. SJZ103]|jgi:tyrosinase|uniref:tyrosinase family protein n=1 Tax=unclassified Pseudomonas TaxID=196821 RepID=UPI001040ACE3|nr:MULTISPECIES: tyrosinase family protein [unclassified Pseudomonas]MCS4311918.1 tyrosinase [Pseudomonas sp. BIGb0381]NJJ56354.1 tyrosinase family protein [Pseudomonas sp. B14(2022)]TWC63929.1 tyrosinase [Pseudomonas sp. SJZ103]TWC81318.1 tyrosinase [Pseudomonas sp. SJZ094]